MRPRRSLISQLVLFVLLLAASAAGVEAQDRYPFRVAAFAGVGGAVDDDDGNSLGNGSFQLGFSWISDDSVLVGVRAGQIGFDEGPSGRQGSDLTYATIGGEYLFNEGYYTSGIYLGLGWYALDEDELPQFPSEDAVGLALGVTGDFRLTARFSILVELSGHYTDLDAADLLAMGHVGVAFRF
jgi:hypothetical protein